MYCKQCGSQLEDADAFCKYCGTKVNGSIENIAQMPTIQNQMQEPSNNQPIQKAQDNPAHTFAILGFVFSFLFSLIGLILSSIALRKYNEQTNKEGKGLAVAGLVLSIISVVITTFYFMLIIALIQMV